MISWVKVINQPDENFRNLRICAISARRRVRFSATAVEQIRMGRLCSAIKDVQSQMGTIRFAGKPSHFEWDTFPALSNRFDLKWEPFDRCQTCLIAATSHPPVEKRPLISQGRGVVSPQRRLMGSEFGRSTSREPAALRLLLINRRLPARCRGSPLNRPRPAGPGNPGPGSDARPSRSPPATSRSPRRYSWR